MFIGTGTSITSIPNAVMRLKNIKDGPEFSAFLTDLRNFFKTLETAPQCLMELEQRAYYVVNEYSDKETMRNLDAARNRVIAYLEQTMTASPADDRLLTILDNYYLFLEALLERPPHRRGGIQNEQLSGLKIQNEYDVQHLLYAYLKPLYPLARAEASEDTGYGTVRADILLDSEHVIEVKCTRCSMPQKKLIEEIEADMVHYHAEHLYFFIYDKEKIIQNPQLFRNIYENKVKGKQIHIVIHQPKIL
ncbi:hypothetical protein [uncultured Acetatifactor sp.]|uniref:PD-(D/E)XK nuclease domain-containing protein n=1 Tax=uncultured Acetatifactor sp. TaxID=1671927 RepID=UPI002622C714|nr:hypothetical protein [uncultured Acetatifactor sp.]